MSTLIDITDSIVAQLNVTQFSQTLNAVRHYRPTFELPDMHTLRVSVVPRAIGSTSLDRKRDTFEYQIDVGVQKKVESVLAELDPLMNLVEEIADHFRKETLLSYPDARCTEIKNEPAYSPEHLTELGQFTSVLTLTFRVWR